jgi:enoyl-[acyl-carrier-protein] reductase (NADH)
MAKLRLITLVALASCSLFSHIAAAQSDADSAAMKEIAAVVATLNHFPSDDDFATLDAIIANSALSADVRMMADTVANIEHSANEEGKGAMETIAGNASASKQAKDLAEIIGNFSHSASASAKEELAKLFP